MARVQPITSKLAYEVICRDGARESHYKKICDALTVIVQGTSWEIAAQAKMKPDQVWKRIKVLKDNEVLIDTGLMGTTPDGNLAAVYALGKDKDKYTLPKTERQESITAVDFANVLIARGKSLVQKELF